jgi:hypothetical protein
MLVEDRAREIGIGHLGQRHQPQAADEAVVPQRLLRDQAASFDARDSAT